MKYIRKYWLFFALAALAAFLTFFWAQGVGKERATPTPLPKLPEVRLKLEGQGIVKNLPITINTTAQLPQELSIFTVTPKNIQKEEASTIGQTLGFVETPTEARDAVTGLQLIWGEEGRFLFVSTSPVDVIFGMDPDIKQPKEEGQLPLPESMFASLEQTLKNLRLDIGPSPTKSAREIAENKLLQIGFSPVVDDLIVVGPDPIKPLVAARYDKGGELYSLTYEMGFISSETSSLISPKKGIVYPAKTLEEITQTLPAEGKIVSLGEVEDADHIFPTSIQIDNIKPALLFLKHDPNTLYPIFILEGLAQTNLGEQPISIYIPAPKSQYLISE